MIAYTLSVVKEDIPTTYKEAKVSGKDNDDCVYFNSEI